MDTTSFNNNNNIHTPTNYLKFEGKTAFLCLRNIVQDHDFEKACKKIVDEKQKGKVLRDRIFSLPQTTAARLTIDGKSHTLGEDLRDYVKANIQIKREVAEKKRLEEIDAYKKDKKEYDAAMEKNKNKECLMEWTVSNLKAIVKMEKTKDDGAMPTTKRGIVNLYAKCMARKGEEVLIDAPVGNVLQENDQNKEERADADVFNDDQKTAM
jgi:hypothetical protein